MDFDYLIRQTIFTFGTTFTSALPSLQVYESIQSVSYDQAREWFENNLNRFEVSRVENPTMESGSVLVREFFCQFSQVKLRKSYYCITSEFTDLDIQYPNRKGPVLHVGRSINHYFVQRLKEKNEKICCGINGTLLCDNFNSVPTIWHLPLLFASLKARKLLTDPQSV